MAAFRQCDLCNKPYHSYGSKLCNNCLTQADKDFVTIRNYLDEHPGRVNIPRLAEDTEVDERMIMHLVDEGRLDTNNLSGKGISCRLCGSPVASGGNSMCNDCKNSLARQLDASQPKAPPAPSGRAAAPGAPGAPRPGGGRMHTSDMKKRRP